ncbi:hypothetical protein PISMIDRAFT_679508 [Pisolithus microcarpus 441]|uniref:Uncharacterized protein n=1 Tax=Pisolithus microcarpus 441 TaxID=765257 RepID=A0A0C9ZLH8_9AGAM|nr:hypothetical protein PISMIDRAFT_679508 [Pisolithus microcarpus 441]
MSSEYGLRLGGGSIEPALRGSQVLSDKGPISHSGRGQGLKPELEWSAFTKAKATQCGRKTAPLDNLRSVARKARN